MDAVDGGCRPSQNHHHHASNEEHLMRQLNVVVAFTNAIKMEMVLNKYAVIHVKRGKFMQGEGMTIHEGTLIQRPNDEETFKYIGIKQGLENNACIANNRPDIAIFNKLKNEAIIINITVPADNNVEKTYVTLLV